MNSRSLGSVTDTTAEGAGRWPLSRISDSNVHWAVGLSWFGLAFIVMLWMYGGASARSFITPDEARERQAAEAFAQSGRVRIDLVDGAPSGLPTPRGWVVTEDTASFVGPGLSPIIRGTLLRLPLVGGLAVMTISALGLASLAAAGALIASRWRFALGLATPLIAFPATFWLSHYWMNMAVFDAMIAVAALAWIRSWRAGPSTSRWLFIYGPMIAIAMAIRPDFALYTVAISFALVRMITPTTWRHAIALHVVIGTAAVLLVLLSNVISTGSPLDFGYLSQRAERSDLTGIRRLPPILDAGRILISPQGIPSLKAVLTIVGRNFFVLAGALMALTALTLGNQLFGKRRSYRMLGLMVIALLLVTFAVVRASPNLNAAGGGPITPQNSYVRYMSPVFLVLSLGVVGGLGSMPSRTRILSLLPLGISVLIGAYYLFAPFAVDSLYAERARTERLESTARETASLVASESLILTCSADKVLWHISNVGSIRDSNPAEIAELTSVVAANRLVFFAGVPDLGLQRVATSLEKHGFELAQLGVADLWAAVSSRDSRQPAPPPDTDHGLCGS